MISTGESEQNMVRSLSALLFFCGSFALCGAVAAQSGMRYADIPADSLRLRVVFPADGDSVSFDRIRYAGSTRTWARIMVQGIETKVYESGGFAGLVSLEPGMNAIAFCAEDGFGTVCDTLNVFRIPPREPLPEVPTAILLLEIEPSSDVSVLPGDILEVEFRGSPGGQATFSIDKIGKNLVMVEKTSGGKGLGIYQGQVIVPDLRDYKPHQVKFRFHGNDSREIEFRSRGKINVLSPILPVMATTVDSSNLVYTKHHGEIWMDLPQDIRVRVVGERNGFAKIQIAENVTGYMESRQLRGLPRGESFPFASIGPISCVRAGDWLQLRVRVSDRVPFRMEQLLESSALEVTFYGARQAPQWISYPEDDETIRSIRWRQETDDLFVLRIDLSQKQQWGYWGRYVGNQFWLSIRESPRLSGNPVRPLEGLTITVDAGHGGEFEGAVSATGFFEKEFNLSFAKKTSEILSSYGAEVIMTRDTDSTVSLQKRISIARAADSHIFVSLHNNSIGAATDPLRPRGTSTYYTVPQSEAVARNVYQRLLSLKLNPFGRIISTYYVTRQTSLISFLVEAAFVTHPEDEMLLLDDAFLQSMAQAVADGIRDFIEPFQPANGQAVERSFSGFSPTEPDTTQAGREQN